MPKYIASSNLKLKVNSLGAASPPNSGLFCDAHNFYAVKLTSPLNTDGHFEVIAFANTILKI